MLTRPQALIAFILLLALAVQPQASLAAKDTCSRVPEVKIDSLSQLSVDTLRRRSYSSRLNILNHLGDGEANSGERPAGTSSTGVSHSSFMSTYTSDGLRLYARLDIPSMPPPATGYPVVIFAPGWISREDAPNFDFATDSTGLYGEIVRYLLAQGFAVVVPGYRGRGTVDSVPADGIDFIDAWGNGSYLSPIFYSLDLLNVLAGVASLNEIDWTNWGFTPGNHPTFDSRRVSLSGHSQGGDVILNTLAVVGNNPRFPQPVLAASIWSGNIPDRFTQLQTFGPMGSTLQAFMSGDGSWTGSAQGKKGERNPDFVFPWPSDWIGTLDTASPEWTWQAESWSRPTVRDALRIKLEEMYDTLNDCVLDMDELAYTLVENSEGATEIKHDPRVAAALPLIGGYHHEKYLVTPLSLHISDRDYYSLPAWNQTLAERVNRAGGNCRVFVYPGTNHSLKASKHLWFSPAGTVDGAPIALERDSEIFHGSERGSNY